MPVTLTVNFSTERMCIISSALPCGRPSATSTKTTSARFLLAMICAAGAPTLPAPTMVTLLTIPSWSPSIDSLSSIVKVNNPARKHFTAAFAFLHVFRCLYRCSCRHPICSCAISMLEQQRPVVDEAQRTEKMHFWLEVLIIKTQNQACCAP